LSSDKKTVWVQAVVLILLAGTGYVLAAVYARNIGQAAELLEAADSTAAPVRNGPLGAPTREQVAQLHEALRQKLGTNARGLSRIAHLDYDGWPDRMHVVLALDHNPLTMTPAQAVELNPLLDVVRGIHDAGLQWRCILVSATAPIEAPGHKIAEASIVRAVFSREKLDKADWSHLTAVELTALAEQFTVDPTLSELRKLVIGKDETPRPRQPPPPTPTTSPAIPSAPPEASPEPD
jgi:hypothetical protein